MNTSSARQYDVDMQWFYNPLGKSCNHFGILYFLFWMRALHLDIGHRQCRGMSFTMAKYKPQLRSTNRPFNFTRSQNAKFVTSSILSPLLSQSPCWMRFLDKFSFIMAKYKPLRFTNRPLDLLLLKKSSFLSPPFSHCPLFAERDFYINFNKFCNFSIPLLSLNASAVDVEVADMEPEELDWVRSRGIMISFPSLMTWMG